MRRTNDRNENSENASSGQIRFFGRKKDLFNFYTPSYIPMPSLPPVTTYFHPTRRINLLRLRITIKRVRYARKVQIIYYVFFFNHRTMYTAQHFDPVGTLYQNTMVHTTVYGYFFCIYFFQGISFSRHKQHRLT